MKFFLKKLTFNSKEQIIPIFNHVIHSQQSY